MTGIPARYVPVAERIISICGLLYGKSMLAGTDGNVSVRLDTSVMTTVSGVHKGMLRESDLVIVGYDGGVLYGDGKPSSELAMHLEIYRKAVSVNAVVHTHPPWTTALSLAGCGYDTGMLAESSIMLSEVVEVPYEEPGSMELALAVGNALGRGPALVLERHGALTVGKDLDEAFCIMECLEHNARIIALSYMIARNQG